MGFRNGAYCTVWEVDKKDKFCNVSLSISKKNKKTNEYENEFSSKYVRFCGNVAMPFAQKLKKGDRVRLISTDVTLKEYEGKWNPSFLVYEAEMAEGSNQNKNSRTTQNNPVESNNVEGSSPWG